MKYYNEYKKISKLSKIFERKLENMKRYVNFNWD